MYTTEEARTILLELIHFSTIDGQLHAREKQFIEMIALSLQFPAANLLALYHEEMPIIPAVSEFERYQQFYRLALIMFCDQRIHEREWQFIQEVALRMGLNLSATKRILHTMKRNPQTTIKPAVLMQLIQEQHN
ncbi:MAG: excinuclease ABC subunit B [Flavobacterium sp. BFFFF2]|nr:MAG: excinuclease ABC subunit B [Flavobacterium sp. BFFFF2]